MAVAKVSTTQDDEPMSLRLSIGLLLSSWYFVPSSNCPVVSDIVSTGFRDQFVEDVDLVGFSVGYCYERRDVVTQIH